MTTVLAFLLTIAILVAVHEWGHFQMARSCGVRVLRFSIGFGPVLWRRQTHPAATEFVVCALPLGGYVRMLDTREDEVPSAERPQAFDQRPLFQRSLIVAAGPLANLVLAVLLYAAASWVGTQEPAPRVGSPVTDSLAARAGLQAGDRVQQACRLDGECRPVASLSQLHWQVVQAAMDREPVTLEVASRDGGHRRITLPTDRLDSASPDEAVRRLGLTGAYSAAVMGRTTPDGPAARAGLQAGDRVLRVDGLGVPDAANLRERIRAAGADGTARTQVWQIDRGGRGIELQVTPRVIRQEGLSIGRIDAAVGEAPERILLRLGPLEGMAQGWRQAVDMSVLTVRMLWRMLTGEASLRNLSGPLTIADAAGQTVERGLPYYLGFLAVVSVSLFVLNLVPLPMLDGGHLMYHLFEAVTGRPPSEEWLSRLQRVGTVILFLLMGLAVANDLTRYLGLNH